jgi:hypothetical protein
VGVTPYLDAVQAAHVENWEAYGGAESRWKHRQREVVMWMTAHSPSGDWLAIDDRAEYFHKESPHLFLVTKLVHQGDSGITEFQAPVLEARLRSILNRPTVFSDGNPIHAESLESAPDGTQD